MKILQCMCNKKILFKKIKVFLNITLTSAVQSCEKNFLNFQKGVFIVFVFVVVVGFLGGEGWEKNVTCKYRQIHSQGMGRGSYLYNQDLSLTHLASRRSGVDPHLASSVAIIDLKLPDLHEVRWTNDSRIRRVANIKWRTCKSYTGTLFYQGFQHMLKIHAHTHVLIKGISVIFKDHPKSNLCDKEQTSQVSTGR